MSTMSDEERENAFRNFKTAEQLPPKPIKKGMKGMIVYAIAVLVIITAAAVQHQTHYFTTLPASMYQTGTSIIAIVTGLVLMIVFRKEIRIPDPATVTFESVPNPNGKKVFSLSTLPSWLFWAGLGLLVYGGLSFVLPLPAASMLALAVFGLSIIAVLTATIVRRSKGTASTKTSTASTSNARPWFSSFKAGDVMKILIIVSLVVFAVAAVWFVVRYWSDIRAFKQWPLVGIAIGLCAAIFLLVRSFKASQNRRVKIVLAFGLLAVLFIAALFQTPLFGSYNSVADKNLAEAAQIKKDADELKKKNDALAAQNRSSIEERKLNDSAVHAKCDETDYFNSEAMRYQRLMREAEKLRKQQMSTCDAQLIEIKDDGTVIASGAQNYDVEVIPLEDE